MKFLFTTSQLSSILRYPKQRKGRSRMIHHLKMTVLVDNIAELPFLCEWGLSILIEADETKILLDTGSSDMFAKTRSSLVFIFQMSTSVFCLMPIVITPTEWILSSH